MISPGQIQGWGFFVHSKRMASTRQKISNWISAFRLRTLPLSFSLVIMGAALALQQGKFDLTLFLLTLLTTLFLQILSNLSNDYGDTVNGADLAGREGPARAVQSGAIDITDMRKAIVIFAILSFVAGIILLGTAYAHVGWMPVAILLGIGVLCIIAAITYTVGKHPYGYAGLGDLSVFIFFGLVGVVGSYYLQAGELYISIWLPAISIGFLSCGVLNMNNMRDEESDRRANKRTIPTYIGRKGAAIYQMCLVSFAILTFTTYITIYGAATQYICAIAYIPLIKNILGVLKRHNDTVFLDSQLKVISISTFALSLLFMVGTLVATT